MKISAELYGEKIGVNGNLKDLIEKKECQILFTLKNDDNSARIEFILSRDQSLALCGDIAEAFKVAAENGFKVV